MATYRYEEETRKTTDKMDRRFGEGGWKRLHQNSQTKNGLEKLRGPMLLGAWFHLDIIIKYIINFLT